MLYYILMNPDFPSSVVVVRQVNHLLFRDFVSSGGKVIVVEVPIYKHLAKMEMGHNVFC